MCWQQTNKGTDRQTDSQTDRQPDSQTVRQTKTDETDRQTDRQTDKTELHLHRLQTPLCGGDNKYEGCLREVLNVY